MSYLGTKHKSFHKSIHFLAEKAHKNTKYRNAQVFYLSIF